jgi:hypothetical protein
VAFGIVVSLVVPGLGPGTGIALGAIVSPTDAVATSIVRRVGVTPRVVTVLEGERAEERVRVRMEMIETSLLDTLDAEQISMQMRAEGAEPR